MNLSVYICDVDIVFIHKNNTADPVRANASAEKNLRLLPPGQQRSCFQDIDAFLAYC